MGSASRDGNEALWLLKPGGPFEVRSAPSPVPKAGEVAIRVRAIAINPADAIPGALRRLISPWLQYPTVIGSDVAGEVSAVGEGVTRLRRGDRVLGYATGLDQSRNSPAEGAFQRYVTILDRVCTAIPEDVSYERAAVLPLGVATAAAGLYEEDQLALPLPTPKTRARDGVVLVWGASSSVGCNAVQLAHASGFTVLATAGPKNHDLVRSLGAGEVFDYRDPDVDRKIIHAIGGRSLAGTIAVGGGSLSHAMRIARRTVGSKRISSVYPDPATRTRALLARTRGLRVSTIWGSTPVTSPVGPAIFRDYLPNALADGSFRPAPEPHLLGSRLHDIPDALEAIRKGVSAKKIVVALDAEGAR